MILKVKKKNQFVSSDVTELQSEIASTCEKARDREAIAERQRCSIFPARKTFPLLQSNCVLSSCSNPNSCDKETTKISSRVPAVVQCNKQTVKRLARVKSLLPWLRRRMRTYYLLKEHDALFDIYSSAVCSHSCGFWCFFIAS